MEKNYTIRQVSKVTGLAASTIRYYEKEGLITEIQRNAHGIRYYSQTDIAWVDFLAKLRNMEMPIRDMKEYARLRVEGDKTIARRVVLLKTHMQRLTELEQAIARNKNLLAEKLNYYKDKEKPYGK